MYVVFQKTVVVSHQHTNLSNSHQVGACEGTTANHLVLITAAADGGDFLEWFATFTNYVNSGPGKWEAACLST